MTLRKRHSFKLLKCFPLSQPSLTTFDSLLRLQFRITHSSRYNVELFTTGAARAIMRNPRFKIEGSSREDCF